VHDLVVIDPVTRIEGHAKITIALDDAGAVADARFHVTEFRGFEEFCKGRPVWEMPSLTARTCGICPVSHLLAAAKAGDAIMGVTIPTTATRLRRLVNLGQIVQSHALSFFHLSAPDLLLGMDADPAVRNVFGLMAAEPELARRGIRLRSFGQSVIEAIAGRKVHSPGIVPGGIAAPMTDETRDRLAAALPEARRTAEDALVLFTGMLDRFDREVRAFGSFPSLHLSLANEEGTWENYDGFLRVVDADGTVVADRVEPADYRSIIGERDATTPTSSPPISRPG
jgi:NAD-reducing hydrogenase large subunit